MLIASRKSKFRIALVENMENHFKSSNINCKIIGLKQLSEENASDYNVIVLINTCMAWEMDRNVKKFLNHYQNHHNVIVLTTSSSGKWLPKKKELKYDAISSASKMVKVDNIQFNNYERLLTKVRYESYLCGWILPAETASLTAHSFSVICWQSRYLHSSTNCSNSRK